MDVLLDLWRGTMEIANVPLLTTGASVVTISRLLGLAVMLLVFWKLATVVQHSIQRLADEDSAPGVHLLSRISVYFVWFIGAVIGLNYLGFELSNFAFLGGAVGVGLGFGLQNILHNFVSGMIILLEKSLKLDDIVEIQSGVTGRVTEINLRYTRITTPDLVDILVPNSEFIGGRVVNWTYGEAVRRIHVPFSVAYGTNKELVREAGMAAALSVQGTLSEAKREPDVWLVKMGDNGLEFELVVWVDKSVVSKPAVTQATYLWALETELSKRGIEIPFPQRDLYIKNSKLTVILEKPAAPA